jgi:ABC-type multidrug transport system ATPase subunit
METLYEWMQAARSRGETTIFSTQVLEQAESVADRVLFLREGDLAFIGPSRELIAMAGVAEDDPRPLAKAVRQLAGKAEGER